MVRDNNNTSLYPDTGLVVAAAGASSRFGGEGNKLLADLDGLPVLCHCLRRLVPFFQKDYVNVMIRHGERDTFESVIAQCGKDIADNVQLLEGGASRQESVAKGIRALPSAAEYVAIQDGARTFPTPSLLEECISRARETGSGVAASPVKDTVKFATPDGRVESTPDRQRLWYTETPQVFYRKTIEDAYAKTMAEGWQVTDDAQAVELNGGEVWLVEHQDPNPKITYAADLSQPTPPGDSGKYEA